MGIASHRFLQLLNLNTSNGILRGELRLVDEIPMKSMVAEAVAPELSGVNGDLSSIVNHNYQRELYLKSISHNVHGRFC